MASVNTTGEEINPFPGLRPFTAWENEYFFGRESETREIVEKLFRNRFVAITGESGSGKSSLIHCGLIPEIRSRSEPDASSWRILSIKPGKDPLGNLADSFVEGYLNPDQQRSEKDEILKILTENSDGLTTVLKKFPVAAGEKILLIIDQFEELFRYGSPERGKGFIPDTGLMINLITKTIASNYREFYCIVALRSDLVSECSHFKIFTQLVNNSNFLLPVMTRENLKDVITGPINVAGAKIDEELVELLLDELNESTDQLPLLQHALMRTWNMWMDLEQPDRPISLSDYYSIGTMKYSISRHADEKYEELSTDNKLICEKLFKIITGIGSDNKGIRYPSNIRTIMSAIPCSRENLADVIEKFREPSISVITPHYKIPLTDDTIIDLSHESLIHLWERLKRWVEEEAASVQMYQQLSDSSALYQQGKSGLLKPPDLDLAIKWRDENNPTLWWAQKYNPAYERAMVYLRTSEKEYLEAEEQNQKRQRWRLKRIRIISSVLGAIVVMSVLTIAAVSLSKIQADKRRKETEKQKEELATQKILADQYAAFALIRSVESDSIANSANMEASQEKEMREKAESQLSIAKKEVISAINIQRIFKDRNDSLRIAGQIAEKEASAAIEQKNLIQEKRMVSVAKSMSLRSLQLSAQKDLQALLAYQAYLFNKDNNGYHNDADIYSGLYQVALENGSPLYRTFSGHDDQIRSIAFVPGTREFFTSGSDGKVLSWNLDDKAESYKVIYSGNEIIDVLAVSPDAGWLACGEESAAIRMIPINGNGSAYELKGHTGKIRSLVFSFDGNSLYSAAVDGKVLKWDLAAHTSVDLSTNGVQITSIDLSSNGSYIAGISNDGNALIWNQNESRDNFRIGSTGKKIKTLRFKPDEERIAVGYDDGTIELWDVSERRKITEFIAHNGEVEDIRFNPRHPQIATTGSDGRLKLWDSGDLSVLPVSFSDNRGPVIAIDFSPDGEVILSAYFEGKPQVVGRPTYAETLAADGCNYVTRNFTPDEWITYVGKDIAYDKTCPGADLRIRIKPLK